MRIKKDLLTAVMVGFLVALIYGAVLYFFSPCIFGVCDSLPFSYFFQSFTTGIVVFIPLFLLVVISKWIYLVIRGPKRIFENWPLSLRSGLAGGMILVTIILLSVVYNSLFVSGPWFSYVSGKAPIVFIAFGFGGALGGIIGWLYGKISARGGSVLWQKKSEGRLSR